VTSLHTAPHAVKRHPHLQTMRAGGRQFRAALWKASPDTDQPPARPLLFFNGIGANIELMAPLADWLPNRDIFTFDMPGVGGSPSPIVPYRASTMATCATQMLKQLDYTGQVDVMGVSWGGAMAQQFTLQHPSRVGRLVLAATTAGMLMIPGSPKALVKMANPRRYVDPNYMRANFETLYGDELGDSTHTNHLRPPSQLGYLYQLAAMAGWTSALSLPFMSHQTLIVMGRDDKIVPVINGRFLASLIPKGRLEIVPGGHLFMVTKPQTSIPLIDEFLSEPD